MKCVLGFSGGVDSQAAALWLRQRYPAEDVILTNCDPGGNEHPVTTEFIAWYSANVHPVITITPIVADMAGRGRAAIERMGLAPTDPLTFDVLAQIKGCWPASQSQFCTTHLKLEPMRRWCWENGHPGFGAATLNDPRKRRDGTLWRPYGDGPQPAGILSDGFERYAGVRRDESRRRRDVADREFDDFFLCWLNRPIAAWSKIDCFDSLRAAGERWNPLYDLGFPRVGCAPCINSGKDDIRLWAARFPAMIDKIRGWEAKVGRMFFPPIMPDGRGGSRRGWIDEVVEWSRTARGGKQYELPILEADVDAGMCMSQYGTCE